MSWFRWPRWIIDSEYDRMIALLEARRNAEVLRQMRDMREQWLFEYDVRRGLESLEVLPYDPESLGTDGGRSAP